MTRIPPPPTPWIARPIITTSIVGAAPQIADPIANSASEASVVGRRPKIAAKPPVQGMKAVEVRAYLRARDELRRYLGRKGRTYELPTQLYSLELRSCAMTGSAVEMLVKSKADRKQETQSERKMSQNRLSFLNGEAGLGESSMAMVLEELEEAVVSAIMSVITTRKEEPFVEESGQQSRQQAEPREPLTLAGSLTHCLPEALLSGTVLADDCSA